MPLGSRECGRGDPRAREELYTTYSPRILALCMRYTKDRSAAEDLMQDAFIKIFRVIRKFKWERQGSLYSWMSRVTLNLCFDSMKKRRRLAAMLTDAEGLERIPDEPPDYDRAASIPAERLRAMVEELPDGIQAVLHRRAFTQGDLLPVRNQGKQRLLQSCKGKGDIGKED